MKLALNIEAEVVVDSSAKQVKDVCMSGKIGHPGGVLYQTLMHGLFKSTDEGRTWACTGRTLRGTSDCWVSAPRLTDDYC